jgi:hypothetical protein
MLKEEYKARSKGVCDLGWGLEPTFEQIFQAPYDLCAQLID